MNLRRPLPEFGLRESMHRPRHADHRRQLIFVQQRRGLDEISPGGERLVKEQFEALRRDQAIAPQRRPPLRKEGDMVFVKQLEHLVPGQPPQRRGKNRDQEDRKDREPENQRQPVCRLWRGCLGKEVETGKGSYFPPSTGWTRQGHPADYSGVTRANAKLKPYPWPRAKCIHNMARGSSSREAVISPASRRTSKPTSCTGPARPFSRPDHPRR